MYRFVPSPRLHGVRFVHHLEQCCPYDSNIKDTTLILYTERKWMVPRFVWNNYNFKSVLEYPRRPPLHWFNIRISTSPSCPTPRHRVLPLAIAYPRRRVPPLAIVSYPSPRVLPLAIVSYPSPSCHTPHHVSHSSPPCPTPRHSVLSLYLQASYNEMLCVGVLPVYRFITFSFIELLCTKIVIIWKSFYSTSMNTSNSLRMSNVSPINGVSNVDVNNYPGSRASRWICDSDHVYTHTPTPTHTLTHTHTPAYSHIDIMDTVGYVSIICMYA